jgi:hypothetical protein
MNRRDVLPTLGWAATTASLDGLLNPDEHERIEAVLNTPSRIDIRTIEHFETIFRHRRHQDDAQLLSVLGDASRHAGWLSFNLNEFTSAAPYCTDARTLAHEAQNYAVAAEQWANRTDDMRLRAHCTAKVAKAYAADGRRRTAPSSG